MAVFRSVVDVISVTTANVVVIANTVTDFVAVTDTDVVTNIDVAGIDDGIAAVITAAMVATTATAGIITAVITATKPHTHSEKTISAFGELNLSNVSFVLDRRQSVSC